MRKTATTLRNIATLLALTLSAGATACGSQDDKPTAEREKQYNPLSVDNVLAGDNPVMLEISFSDSYDGTGRYWNYHIGTETYRSSSQTPKFDDLLAKIGNQLRTWRTAGFELTPRAPGEVSLALRFDEKRPISGVVIYSPPEFREYRKAVTGEIIRAGVSNIAFQELTPQLDPKTGYWSTPRSPLG